MPAPTLRQVTQGKAYRLVMGQWAGILVVSLLIFLLTGKTGGVSALLGGLAYGLPNLIFVTVVFRYVGASQSVQFLTAFFMGEMLKLILSGVLFLMIVKYLPVSLLSVLVGFFGAIVSFWVASFYLFGKPAH